MSLKKVFLFSISLGSSFFGYQKAIANDVEPLRIDLSNPPAIYVKYMPVEKLPTIVIDNFCFQKEYVIFYEKIQNAIPPLDYTPPTGKANIVDSCKDLYSIIERFNKLKSETRHIEKDVKDCLISIKSLINDCTDASIKKDANKILENSASKTIAEGVDLGEGDEIVITITRDDLKWIYYIRESSLALGGRWVITYGLTDIFSTNMFIKKDLRERYSDFKLIKNDSENSYSLFPDNDKSAENLVPSIFFSWLSYTKSWLKIVPIAGLSIDLQNPTVLLGVGFNIQSNIIFSIGGTLHKRSRLKAEYYDKYTRKIALKDLVDEESLVDQRVQIGFYASLSFRFKSNPFSTGSSKKTEDTATKTDNKK